MAAFPIPINQEDPIMRRVWTRGFTLIELLVVIAIIAILAAILFPVFAQARAKARQTACLSNLKQIGTAVMMYTQDYDEYYPVDASACGTLGGRNDPCSKFNPNWRPEAETAPYIKNTGVFQCLSSTRPLVIWDANRGVCSYQAWGFPDFMCFPGDTTQGKPMSYGWNQSIFFRCDCGTTGVNMASVVAPASKVMVADALHPQLDWSRLPFANYTRNTGNGAVNTLDFWFPPASNGGGEAIIPETHTRHSLGENIAFLDGHAKWVHYRMLTGDLIAVQAKWFDHTQP
jgi:prepilin-type N-terminal cleavage/methylation domain-containing protein/prepilin-type processing-associated H-X9-DG protein